MDSCIHGQTDSYTFRRGAACCRAIVFGGCAGALQAGDGEGAVVFETRVIEAGADFGAEKLSLSFPFTNTGGETLTVTRVESGCGCLEAGRVEGSFAPGEAGEVPVVFKTKNEYGTVRKSLRVDFSDGSRHELVAVVTIPEALVIEPSNLVWELGAEADEQRIDVRVAEGPGLDITAVISSMPQFVVRHEVVEAGRHYTIHIKPESTANKTMGVIQVRTSSGLSRDAIRAVFVSVRDEDKKTGTGGGR